MIDAMNPYLSNFDYEVLWRVWQPWEVRSSQVAGSYRYIVWCGLPVHMPSGFLPARKTRAVLHVKVGEIGESES